MNPRVQARLRKLSLQDRLQAAADDRLSNTAGHTHRTGIAPAAPVQQYLNTDRDPHTVLMYGSNSYHSLNIHPLIVHRVSDAVQRTGIGAGGSPYFSGYTSAHAQLESRFARLARHERSMLLPSGYAANLAWVSGLVRPCDVVVYDTHSHASTLDGITLSGATGYKFDPTLGPRHLEHTLDHALKESTPGADLYLTVEGVRSIDGGIADLQSILTLARSRNAFAVLDDSHGFGVVGSSGRGTIETLSHDQYDLTIFTCSKALGAQGGVLASSQHVVDYLRQIATPYVFTTAMSVANIAALDGGLDVLFGPETPIGMLHSNRCDLRTRLTEAGFSVGHTDTGIVPVYINHDDLSALCSRLFDAGLFVNVVEYPMIPALGRNYLRFSVMSSHTPELNQRATDILSSVVADFASTPGHHTYRITPSRTPHPEVRRG